MQSWEIGTPYQFSEAEVDQARPAVPGPIVPAWTVRHMNCVLPSPATSERAFSVPCMTGLSGTQSNHARSQPGHGCLQIASICSALQADLRENRSASEEVSFPAAGAHCGTQACSCSFHNSMAPARDLVLNNCSALHTKTYG